MFFDPFSQGSARFPYVGAGVVDVSALVLVYYSCLVGYGVLVFGGAMDQQHYNNKAWALLQDTNTYKVLHKDLTPQLKNKFITLLKNTKQTGGLSTQKHK